MHRLSFGITLIAPGGRRSAHMGWPTVCFLFPCMLEFILGREGNLPEFIRSLSSWLRCSLGGGLQHSPWQRHGHLELCYRDICARHSCTVLEVTGVHCCARHPATMGAGSTSDFYQLIQRPYVVDAGMGRSARQGVGSGGRGGCCLNLTDLKKHWDLWQDGPQLLRDVQGRTVVTMDTFTKDRVAQEGREDGRKTIRHRWETWWEMGIRRVGRRQEENEGGSSEAGRTGPSTNKTEKNNKDKQAQETHPNNLSATSEAQIGRRWPLGSYLHRPTSVSWGGEFIGKSNLRFKRISEVFILDVEH